ncbi:pyridoxal phosphate-dependent aminotransferase [Oxyplasma meridianum]|uniref:Aminotransferase n=1 Tax=Oxyplasma meridianum TaxID=3073602 RepID=A0AAX4NGL2_9ARCH
MVSSRLSAISESKTVASSNKAAEMARNGKKIYNFGIGEPDFTTPENIIDAGFQWAKKGKTHYTSSMGIPELREAISAKFKKFNGIQADPKNILVTPTKFSINLALMSILEFGDEVILPEPYYVSYPDIVRLAGGKVIPIGTDENYDFDFDAMGKVVNPRTRAIVFSNPTNPTGKVYTEKMIRELSDFVLENNLYLVSDEIYEDIIFEGRPFSPASIPDMKDHTITVSGFSKSHAMTGWRIGYMTGPADIIQASNKIQQQTITCAASISQYAALEALVDEKSPAVMREKFRERRDLIYKLITEGGQLEVRKPEGAFYIFPGYEGKDSETVSSHLLDEEGVVVTPGSAFGEQGEKHLRISFATSDETIREGVERINSYFRKQK